MNDKKVKYSDIKGKIRSGDIFLFSGSSSISRDIEVATGSKFSHVTIIYRHDDNAKPLIFQAGVHPLLLDPVLKVKHGGAQFAGLEDAIKLMDSKKYGDQPYWRSLQYDRPPNFNELMLKAMSKIVNRPFPSILGMVEEWVEGQFHHFTGDNTFFCAELVAYVFQEMKMLPQNPPANWYDPKAFSEVHQRIKFSDSATLGEEFEVDPN